MFIYFVNYKTNATTADKTRAAAGTTVATPEGASPVVVTTPVVEVEVVDVVEVVVVVVLGGGT